MKDVIYQGSKDEQWMNNEVRKELKNEANL